MGEQEVRTADASGVVKVQSPQQEPKAKATAKKAPSARRAGKPAPLEVNERGVPVTKFDDEALNPNERTHVGEDPTGESNVKK